jgi:hypothetical protein
MIQLPILIDPRLGVHADPREGLGGLHQVVLDPEFSFVRKIKSKMMSPRRHKEREVSNETMGEEMRQICAILDAMETVQRRDPNVGDINEAESEEVEEKGVAGEEVAKE